LGYTVKDTSSSALIPILKGNFTRVFRSLEQYDAVEDTPWYIIYKELDKYSENTKFILTLRDTNQWYKSVNRHIGKLRLAQHEFVYGRGKGLPKENESHTKAVYETHIQEVKAYFRNRPNDLLVLDFTKGDGWEKLCAFLDKEIPSRPFPHYNNSADNKQVREMPWYRYFRKQLKAWIKIKYIDILGLWPKRNL
jgi:hypothetical protein